MPNATEFAATVALIVISVEPLNDALPLKSPPKLIVRAVAKVVAVLAFPVVSALIVEGKLSVTAPADADTSTSFAVPRTLVTPVFAIVRVPAPSL